MPVYSYICEECGENFDLLVGVTSEKTGLKCRKCESKNIKRVLSSFGIGNSKHGTGSSGPACPTGTCPTSF